MRWLVGVSASLWFVAAAAAQTSRIEGGSTSLGNVVFHYETRLEPPVPPLGDSLTMLIFPSNGPNVSYNGAAPDTVHRVMIDRTQKVLFGYDAVISTWGRTTLGRSDDRGYRVTFRALSMTPDITKVLGEDVKTWQLLPAPRFPEPREIRSGEVLELTLLSNSKWGQRITEYVTVQDAPRRGFNAERPREFVFAGGNPRDFTTADVVLTLTEPRITWTSPTGIARTALGDATGGIIWVYAPNAGRLLLSLTPHRQFVRAGSVRGTSMTFQVDGNTYSINSATRIAPGDAAFNLYVLRQPNWKPTFAHANLDAIHMGAADRAEYLLEK